MYFTPYLYIFTPYLSTHICIYTYIYIYIYIYISCWVEFLNSSKENLFLDYKCILAIYKKGILITDTLSKAETLSQAVQRLLPT